eukprot:10523092-Alexandrium_andersonii.AAC.1
MEGTGAIHMQGSIVGSEQGGTMQTDAVQCDIQVDSMKGGSVAHGQGSVRDSMQGSAQGSVQSDS